MRGTHVVIYLWKGERHRSDAFAESVVYAVLAEYRAKGFNAWVETL